MLKTGCGNQILDNEVKHTIMACSTAKTISFSLYNYVATIKYKFFLVSLTPHAHDQLCSDIILETIFKGLVCKKLHEHNSCFYKSL